MLKRLIAAAVACAFAAQSHAQTYTSLHWGIDRAATPNEIAVQSSDGSQWFKLFKLTAAGTPTPYFASTFCAAGEFITATAGVPSCATPSELAPMAANSVKANVTGSSAAPIDVGLPSCSTSASALNYVSGTGFSCNTALAVPAASITGTTLASNVVTSSLTAFGTGPTINQPIVNGITSGSAAAAGVVGQLTASSVASGSAVSLTTATAANVTSVSLTAGDWNCWGNVNFYPAGSTTISSVAGWISTTSAAVPTRPNLGSFTERTATMTTGGNQGFSVGQIALTLASTTTVYLEAYSTFGTSTMTAGGYIGCRRVR